MTQTLAVIPARYAATRFPGKPLADIDGKPMIRRVWEQVQKATLVQQIIIATDDKRIVEAARQFGATAIITSPDHLSGTDRVWEVASQYPQYDLVFNVQGDEPFLEPETLDEAIRTAARFPTADIITAVTPVRSREELNDPNCVKAVLDTEGRALYFSRAPIPHHRDQADSFENAHRHLGLYLYRRHALERFTQLPPSCLETTEKLEQLRALEAGMTIVAFSVARAATGVDTPADLDRLKSELAWPPTP